MSFVVVDPGLSTTVQDQGRPGYRAWGVSPGGAFDRGSAELANALLGNPAGCAVLELTLIGGTFEARAPLALALAGAPMASSVRSPGGAGRTLTLPLSFSLELGERLTLGRAASGVRTYLAVLGGWQTRFILGSRSAEERLKAGDVLPCLAGHVAVRHPAGVAPPEPLGAPIRVVAGPDADRLDPALLSPEHGYAVLPESDRAGLRLDGPAWPVAADPERLSAPVAPGAIQVAGGRPIVLGVACGTMGGYPHVAHVISADLDCVAQTRPGDRLRFERVELGEARRLDGLMRAERLRAFRRIAAAALDLDGGGPAAD
jgi:antagonist of KipI